ncbi:hypothetical protein PC9H_000823 [Pleurotus ostreatus]|uniref:Uncharacterized protein n=2 Tax=Pleurotus ostreatus TaxID=5322 RepID=A0A8H7A2M3_PLEOS|nr:uncharacterized protein PC9H_000823 [Pleurotus ostreatus]KAF7440478.1 hypothetical protein PC9H_000823 [Pleurotus ostreatus]
MRPACSGQPLGVVDKFDDRSQENSNIVQSFNIQRTPIFPPAATQYVSQYHRWTLPHRMRTLRVYVYSLTRLLGDQLLVQSATHTPSWLQINQLYPTDGTPCPKSNQNQPDHLRGLLIEAKDGRRCCSAMRPASPTPSTRHYVRAAGQPMIPVYYSL